MAEFMTNTSSAGMVAAIAEGMAACFLLLAAPGGEWRTEDGVTAAITRLPLSDFNGVVRARLDPRLSDAEIGRRIDGVVTYLRSRGVPFGWWVMPDDPPDLQARLIAHGFKYEGENPGMAIDLEQLGSARVALHETAIEEVINLEDLREHARLVAIGFDMPPEIEGAFWELMQGQPFGPGTSVRYFLAHEQGQPIGTSVVCLSGRAAGIFNVITVPQARGKGVGTLLTDAALRAAREAGYRIAVLESSPMGYNVYRRLGFAEYGKIGHFTWPDEAGT